MKKFLFWWLAGAAALLSGLLSASSARAQAPVWQSAMLVATPVTPNSYSFSTGTAADSLGNVYQAGFFAGTVRFGSIVLTSAGDDDLFVARWNPTQGWLWAQRAGGPGRDRALTLALSGLNVYVSGSFGDAAGQTARFGTTTLTNAGEKDGFVAKLTDAFVSADWTWAKPISGRGDNEASALTVQDSSVYVSGWSTRDTVRFDSTTTIISGNRAGFVAKLTDARTGTPRWTWARRVGGAGNNYTDVEALAVHGGSVYLAGRFIGQLALDSVSVFSPASLNTYVARLDDAGDSTTCAWAQRSGATRIYSLVPDGGSVYAAGMFQSTADFGATTLTSAGGFSDGFIAKLADTGTSPDWVWVQQLGGLGDDDAWAVEVRAPRVYVTGSYSIALGIGGTVLTSEGGLDLYVAQLTDAGPAVRWDWARSAGGLDDDFPWSLIVRGPRVYVAGTLNSSSGATFGPLNVTGVGPNYAGFVAILDAPPPTGLPAEVAGSATFFPNPAHGTTRLTGALPHTALTLLDALGRPVLTTETDAHGAATLDVRALPAGLYAVRGAGVGTRRLVVE